MYHCIVLSALLYAGSIRSPEILEHPGDVVVSRNEPVTLNCKVHVDQGEDDVQVEWFKDGELVSTARDDPRNGF